jgi:DUF4097 and DUF4098 domain-containing protein YvlB
MAMAKTESSMTKVGIASDGSASVDVASGLNIDVRTASGDVVVREGTKDACSIRFRSNDASFERMLEDVICEYSASSNTLVIETRPFDGGRSGSRGIGRFFDMGRRDLDVELYVPELADVRVRTASGDVSVRVDCAKVDVNTASGDLSVDKVSGSVSYHSASGDISAQAVGDGLEVKSASGDVHVGELTGDSTIQSVSGDISLMINAPLRLKANVVSGDIDLGIRRGLVVDIDASTMSGSLRSEIDFDGAADAGGEVAQASAPVRLQLKTVSGDVVVRRA